MDKGFTHQLNIVEENSEINDLHPSVINAITKIAEDEGYIHHKVYEKMITTEGGNFIGMLYEITIKGETVEGNKETNIFVKQVIPNGDKIEFFSITELYNKEIFFYTVISKIFLELQNEANIPMKNYIKLVKMYDQSNINAIILEDLTKQGFKTYGRMDVMEFEYAKLCIEYLAKFHGLGFAIERRMPQYFESNIKSLKQSLILSTDHNVYTDKMFALATSELPSDLKMKIDKWWDLAYKDYSKYLQGTMSDVKSLCHGDFKMNNIMYKRVEGKIAEVIAIDYQFINYGPPIIDFMHFIFMGTDQKFRRKHLEYLKDYYHVSLKKYLKYFDIIVDDVYPRETFEKEFKDSINFGLVSSIWFLPHFLNKGTDTDIRDFKKMYLGLRLDDTYYDRLNGLLDDFFECVQY